MSAEDQRLCAAWRALTDEAEQKLAQAQADAVAVQARTQRLERLLHEAVRDLMLPNSNGRRA